MIYRLRFFNKDGVEERVDIRKGLATPVIEVEGTDNPFTLSYNNDKGNKSGIFLTSSFDIEIYETSDFNIDNLKTSNETELSVTHYINNVVSWQGFIIPDFFSIEVRNNPVITMTASDRLGTLKNVTLSDLPSMVNIRELTLTCLSKTGLTLPLKTMADFSNDDTDNAFFSYYIDSQRIKDIKGRSISCYDILSSILTASNSKLVQRAGEWVIINKLQHEIGSGKIYSSLSSFTNYLENIYNFEEVSIGARRTIIPVAGSVGIYHEHGGRKSHPANYDYSLGLSGWNSVNGFTATIENRHIAFFLGGTPFFDPDRTVKQYLLNYNNWIDNTTNLNTAPYISTDPIQINSPRADRVEVTVDISSTMAEKLSSFDVISFLRYAVILTNGIKTYTLTKAGVFEILNPENIRGHSLLLRGGQQHPLVLASPAFSNSDSFKGLFEVGEDDDVNNYSATIRIYGSGNQYVTVNYALIKFSDVSELPKGTMYKTEQGNVFTKAYDIETSIFGDYLLSGLDGYFYRYPNDDTSSIYKDINTLSSPIWTTPMIPSETSELPILHHSTRQMRRMFSVAHDLLSVEIEVNNFDPLAIFVSCGKRYTVVSGRFNVLKSTLSVELEEVAFQNASVRDFIYSYFGDSESNIKSISGISGGTGGGGTGGGLTSDQVAILSEVQALAHEHGNKGVLDQVTQEVVDNALREMIISTDTEAELTDENYLSSLRVIAEILKNNEDLKEVFLSKIDPDTAKEVITFLKGLISTTADIEDLKADKGDIKFLTSATAIIDNITLHKGMSSEVFFPGFLGEGMELFLDENGNWNFTLDNLTVRKQMNVFELVINRIKHVGGAFLFSPAGGTFIGVEEHDTFWRCYVDKNNNEFEIHDQVICQTFTKNRLKRYWRLAVNIGEDFVDLSKTDCESGSAYPEIDDEAVVLGNRINNARQNAVLISSYGDDGSYQQFLNGVDTYSLADKIDIHFGKESFMRVNRLEIKGTDGKSERVPRDRGIFQLGETYEFYDRVVYNGRYWLCLAINTTSVPSEGEWQEQTNVRAGGKNLLREYDLRFDGKYWQGNYNGQFIDLSMLADYLFNGNNDAIVTENNLYIEI